MSSPSSVLLFGILILCLAVLALGGYFLYRAGREFRSTAAVRRETPVPIRDAADRAGPVEIEGEAVPVDDGRTVTAPFTDTECLAYTFSAEERVDSQTPDDAPRSDDGVYQILDSGTNATEFRIEDETGSVHVDPDGAEFEFETQTHEHFPWRDLPAPIEDYVESTDAVDRQESVLESVPVLKYVATWIVTNDRRFVEGRLDIGETVYVRGQATRTPERDGESVDAVVGDGPEVSDFVVADTSRRATARRFARRGLVDLIKAVAALVAVAIVLYWNVHDIADLVSV